MNLRRMHGAVAAVGVSSLVSIGVQALYTVTTSRLLDPADFGLVAIATLVIRLVSLVARMGLAAQVFRMRGRLDLTEGTIHEELSRFHRVSVAAGVSGMCVTWLCAEPAVRLLGNPEAAGPLRLLSVSVMILGMVQLPETVLRLRYQLAPILYADAAALAIGYLGVGLPLAVVGAGPYSLVAGTATYFAAYAFLVSRKSGRIPLRRGPRKAHAVDLRYSAAMIAIGVLEYASGATDTAAVARSTGPGVLGQYSRATLLVSLPLEKLSQPVLRLFAPRMAEAGTADESRARIVQHGLVTYASSLFTLAVAAAVLAETVVPVVLGSQWAEAVPLVPLVGGAYALALSSSLYGYAFEGMGAARLRLALLVLHVGTLATAVSAAAHWYGTARSIATAWLLSELTRHLLFAFAIAKVLKVPAIWQAKNLAVVGAATLVGAAPTVAVFAIRSTDASPAVSIVPELAAFILWWAWICRTRVVQDYVKTSRMVLGAPNGMDVAQSANQT